MTDRLGLAWAGTPSEAEIRKAENEINQRIEDGEFDALPNSRRWEQQLRENDYLTLPRRRKSALAYGD